MRPTRAYRFIAFALAAGFLLASPVDAQEVIGEPLFRIERSKNANVVQYDAVLRSDGALDRENPIDAYWLRLAKDGSRKELSWLQHRAYGFSHQWSEDGKTLELEMAAPIGRKIEIVRDGDAWRARTVIDGRPSWIEQIYVQSKKILIGRSVEHVDFAGIDVETGEQRTERFVPN